MKHSLHRNIQLLHIQKCAPYFCTLDNSCTFFRYFVFTLLHLFCLDIHTLRYFEAVASLNITFLGILQVLRVLIPISSLSLSTPYRIYRAFMGEFMPKIKSCINLSVLSKMPPCKVGVYLTCCQIPCTVSILLKLGSSCPLNRYM